MLLRELWRAEKTTREAESPLSAEAFQGQLEMGILITYALFLFCSVCFFPT